MIIADRRVAAYGIFGGDSKEHLQESFGDIARDLTRFLTRLAKGQAPNTNKAADTGRPADAQRPRR